MNAQETMHAFYLYFTLVYDQEGRQYLANEFLYGRYDQNVIFQPKEEDNKGCSKIELEIGSRLIRDGYKTCQHKPREDPKPT